MQIPSEVPWPTSNISDKATPLYFLDEEVQKGAIERLAIKLVEEVIGVCLCDSIVVPGDIVAARRHIAN